MSDNGEPTEKDYLIYARVWCEDYYMAFEEETLWSFQTIEEVEEAIAFRYFRGKEAVLSLDAEDLFETAFAKTLDYWEYDEGFKPLEGGFVLDEKKWHKTQEIQFQGYGEAVFVISSESKKSARAKFKAEVMNIAYFSVLNERYEVAKVEVFECTRIKYPGDYFR